MFHKLTDDELARLTSILIRRATEIALRLNLAIEDTDVPEPTCNPIKEEKSND